METKADESKSKENPSIFRFYDVYVDIPEAFFIKMGDSKIISTEGYKEIKKFI